MFAWGIFLASDINIETVCSAAEIVLDRTCRTRDEPTVAHLKSSHRGRPPRLATAVALAVADRDTADSKIPNIVLSTAHAAKFPDAVEAACGVRPELPAWLEGLMTRPEHIKVMANDQAEVERFVRSVSRAAKQGVAG